MTIAVLLWDFGDTLVDEQWMTSAPKEFPEWPAVWAEVVRHWGDDWHRGHIDESQVFGELALQSGLDVAAIERHAAACCQSIRFHPAAWRAVRERRVPQALVTVNSDLFVSRVAEPYSLETYFDAFVVSCAEGTDDKVELCEIALTRLGFKGVRSEALLIDNRRDLIDAWTLHGGAAYDFRGDDIFDADWPAILG